MSLDRNTARRARRGGPSRFVVEPLEDRRLMTVHFASAVKYVGDRAGAVRFDVVHVRHPGEGDDPVQVRVDTVDAGGTAVPGVDYTPVHVNLTFQRHDKSLPVLVPIARDSRAPQDKSIVLSLDGAPYPKILPDPATAATSTGEAFYRPEHRVLHAPQSRGESPAHNAVAFIVHQTDQPPPTVRQSHLLLQGGRVAGFVITFSHDMAPGPVEDFGNYQVTEQSVGNRPKYAQIPLSSAIYDPIQHTVTLIPVQSPEVATYVVQNPQNFARSRLVDTTGNPLDGNGDGLPDGYFSATLTPSGTTRGSTIVRENRRIDAVAAAARARRPSLAKRILDPIGKVLNPLSFFN